MPVDWTLLERIAPEGALLLLCAGPRHNDDAIRRFAQEKSIDWHVLLWMAERERAASVVWRRLSAMSPQLVPESVRDDFKRQSMVSDFSTAYLAQRTSDTIKQWNAVGIEPLLVKGAAMAVSVFNGFTERPMGDVDVLVEPSRAQEAWDMARQVGWVWEPALHPQARYLGHHHLPPLFARKGIDAKLEVHSSVFVAGHPFAFGDKEMLAGATQVSLGGARVKVPTRPSLLFHAILHFAWSHTLAYGGWRTFRDIRGLAEVGLDWGTFERWAADPTAAAACYWPLRLAQRLTGAPIDPGVLERLARVARPRLTGLVERHLTHDVFPQVDGCPSAALRRRLWELAVQPVRSGHGRVRPWDFEEPPEQLAATTLGYGLASVGRNAGRLKAWWRYAREVLM